MIKRIFWGSLRNKLLFILPALLLISAFVPWAIPFILMLGGTYLCFEGAEKVWHKLRGHHEAEADAPAVERGPDAEAKVVKGAITKDSVRSQRAGELLVTGMPAVLAAITLIGTVAMLWVGGHIMLQGAYDLGWHAPYDLVHTLEHPVAGIAVVGGFLGWLVNTLCSAVLGLAWGLVVMAVAGPLLKALPFGNKKSGHDEGSIRAGTAREE
ncbi:MAG: hypothetical protein NVS2B15_24280 [Pseudarthrobacter sp.]